MREPSQKSIEHNRKFRKATINDVATRAGISKTTVSLVLSGRGRACSLETAERVRRAAAELQYVPSPPLRSVRQGATQTLGVCILPKSESGDSTSFTDRLWAGITQEADHADYTLMKYPRYIRDDESNTQAFLDGRIDGLIFSGSPRDERPNLLAAAGLPVVLISNSVALPSVCGSVRADESDTANLALSYLWQQGHRRIAHIAGADVSATRDTETLRGERLQSFGFIGEERCHAYVEWMKQRNLYDPALLAFAETWGFNQHACDALHRWYDMADPPTALFCASDAIALGVLAEAQRLNWRVPEVLSIVSVDNRREAALTEVPLTTVDVPVEKIGSAAFVALQRLMVGVPAAECQIRIPVTELVIRKSVAPPVNSRSLET